MEADVAGLFEDTPPICSPGTREGPRLKVEQRQNLTKFALFATAVLQRRPPRVMSEETGARGRLERA